MSAKVDPRLEPLLAAERGTGTVGGVMGVLLLVLGGAFIAMSFTAADEGALVLVSALGVLMLIPGVLLIRGWIRGPLAGRAMRLLTTQRAELSGWDMQYVSVNGGPTFPRITLFAKHGDHSVNLRVGEEDRVCAYLAEVAPRTRAKR